MHTRTLSLLPSDTITKRTFFMTSRALSFWGWGWADKFPDTDARVAIGTHVGALLSTTLAEPQAPPTLESLELPDPRPLKPPASLSARIDATPHARASHTYGRNYRDIHRGFHRDFSAAPDAVAFPENEEEIASLLDWCAAERIAVVPFGGGTSVVGGVEGERKEGGLLSLDMRRLDRVLEVIPEDMSARIQAGATGPGMEAQLASHGLTLRHYPQSYEHSTLGGWIATRSGGHYATLYTHIDTRVSAIRMLTPRGPFASRQLPASGAGPSPDRLLLGSEGSFGVITEAWVRLHRRPLYRARTSAHFQVFDAAVAAARDVAQSGLYPATCRILDATEAMLNGVSMDRSTVLLLGFESADHSQKSSLMRAVEIARSHGGAVSEKALRVTEPGDEAAADPAQATWREAFIEAPYLLNTMVSLGVVADTFETACTWSRFPALHAALKKDFRGAMKSICGGGILSCRFTHVYPDGPAPYYTFVAPGKRGSEAEQWMELKAAASEILMKHGATITHHHAVGRIHAPWYHEQVPALHLEALSAVKDRLDPEGILNPGVLGLGR